jgi:hypothetical protein
MTLLKNLGRHTPLLMGVRGRHHSPSSSAHELAARSTHGQQLGSLTVKVHDVAPQHGSGDLCLIERVQSEVTSSPVVATQASSLQRAAGEVVVVGTT